MRVKVVRCAFRTLIQRSLRNRLPNVNVEPGRAHRVQLVNLLSVLHILLDNELGLLKAVKLQCLIEFFLAAANEEVMSKFNLHTFLFLHNHWEL